jgi:prolipoprotein diacylglyceryltransferase
VYAAGRFFLSYLRTDPLVFGLRQAQWASLAMILVSMILIAVWMRRRSPQQAVPAEAEAAPSPEPG